MLFIGLIEKKSVKSLLLPIHHFEALVCPLQMNEQTRRSLTPIWIDIPQREYRIIQLHVSSRNTTLIHIQKKTSTVCLALDCNVKFTRFRSVKNKRRVNAIYVKLCNPPAFTRLRASASVSQRKFKYFLHIFKNVKNPSTKTQA